MNTALWFERQQIIDLAFQVFVRGGLAHVDKFRKCCPFLKRWCLDGRKERRMKNRRSPDAVYTVNTFVHARPPSSSLRARSYYFQAGKQKLLKVKYHSQSSVARERPGSNSKVKGKVLVLCRTGTSPSAPRHLSSPG